MANTVTMLEDGMQDDMHIDYLILLKLKYPK